MSANHGCDLMVLAPHPDDAELGCGGTVLRASDRGLDVVVVDCTRGESGTRGTPELRDEEAAKASALAGLKARENLGLPDAQMTVDEIALGAVVRALRVHRPKLLLAPLRFDVHPDHTTTAELAKTAMFLAGLQKRFPEHGPPSRPQALLRYAINDYPEAPAFCIDISDQLPRKLELIRCFSSQIPETPADRSHYVRGLGPLQRTEVRDRFFGAQVGCEAAEPFWIESALRLDVLTPLFESSRP
ncbi:MAG: bacillithiol biosynthesis deacetylase BshB1 [Planctomycetota bacterium]